MRRSMHWHRASMEEAGPLTSAVATQALPSCRGQREVRGRTHAKAAVQAARVEEGAQTPSAEIVRSCLHRMRNRCTQPQGHTGLLVEEVKRQTVFHAGRGVMDMWACIK